MPQSLSELDQHRSLLAAQLSDWATFVPDPSPESSAVAVSRRVIVLNPTTPARVQLYVLPTRFKVRRSARLCRRQFRCAKRNARSPSSGSFRN